MAWDYNKWEAENEEARLVTPEEQVKYNQIMRELQLENERKKAKMEKENRKEKQLGLFEDKVLPNNKKVKKQSRKPSSKMTETELDDEAEFFIKRYAKRVRIGFSQLDSAIDYLEDAAKNLENISIVYQGKELYSLLDDRDSCYTKITGYDYKSYCMLDAIEEQEQE